MGDERAGEADALAHAARQFAGIGGFEPVEADDNPLIFETESDLLLSNAQLIHVMSSDAELEVVTAVGDGAAALEAVEAKLEQLTRAVEALTRASAPGAGSGTSSGSGYTPTSYLAKSGD